MTLFTTEPIMTNARFERALMASEYIYDAQAGSWFKVDAMNHVHTYMHLQDNDWNYEKYDSNDLVLESKAFTL
jgi:hypothetical protein